MRRIVNLVVLVEFVDEKRYIIFLVLEIKVLSLSVKFKNMGYYFWRKLINWFFINKEIL